MLHKRTILTPQQIYYDLIDNGDTTYPTILRLWVVTLLLCCGGWSFCPSWLSHPFKDIIHYFEKNVPLNVVIIYEVHKIVRVLKMLNHFL